MIIYLFHKGAYLAAGTSNSGAAVSHVSLFKPWVLCFHVLSHSPLTPILVELPINLCRGLPSSETVTQQEISPACLQFMGVGENVWWRDLILGQLVERRVQYIWPVGRSPLCYWENTQNGVKLPMGTCDYGSLNLKRLVRFSISNRF